MGSELGVPFELVRLDPAKGETRSVGRKPEEQRDARLIQGETERFHKVAAVLGPGLEDQSFMLGEQFSIADVVMGSCLTWGQRMVGLGERGWVEATSRS